MRPPIYNYRLTHYDPALLPSRFVADLDTGVRDDKAWIRSSGRSLGHPGWGLAYHMALTMLHPHRHSVIVETGTNFGSTAIVLAKAIIDSGRSGEVHTIELDPEIRAEAVRRFEQAGVGGVVTSHCGDSLQVLPQVVERLDEIVMVFLDGNHYHDHVVSEFELVAPKLRPDAVVLFDNTYLIAEGTEDPRVNGALRTILARHGGNLVNLPICSWYTPGMAVWQRAPFAVMDPPQPGSFVPNT